MKALTQYLLHLADNSLVLGHKHSEWCGHGPVLEQDIALTNIALDLLGQARNFYQYAAEVLNADGESGVTEDTLAYLRDHRQFKNCLITELQNGDWGRTILRQFLFSAYQHPLYNRLSSSADDRIAAIAAKSLKEVTYHLRWSSEWVIRLGDGTAESHARMERAIGDLWSYTGELVAPADYETRLATAGISVDPATLFSEWRQRVTAVFTEAKLTVPGTVSMQQGGKEGIHSEQLELILADLQNLQRAYPGCEW